MQTILTRFAQDRRGGTAIFAALSFAALFGVAALALDTSSYFLQKRRLQSAADLAAIAAAGDFTNAQTAAVTSLASNGFDASVIESLETGAYAANAAVAAGSRFTPSGTTGAPAARITLKIAAPLFFARIFAVIAPRAIAAVQTQGLQVSDGAVTIRAKAVASTNPQAAFAVGSRLFQLDGGILNSVLGGMLGTSLSLSLMDYQALAAANVDLFAFSSALATRASLTAASYTDVVNANARVGDIFRAAVDVLGTAGANASASAALTRIASGLTATSTVAVAPLVSFGNYGARSLGGAAPLTTTVSALDLISATAGIANGTNQVQLNLSTSVPGIASATLKLAVGARPNSTSFEAVGAAGASAHTAQTRLLLTVTLVGTPPATGVTLPIYIELASATATLSSVSCTNGQSAATATLAVSPSVADASIGAVSNADFTNFTTAPNPSAATLINVLNLITVTGKAHATVSNLAATPVTFSAADIAAATKKTTSTTDYTASLSSSLVGNLQLTVNTLGFGLGLPTNLDTAVAGVIAAAATPVDLLLNQVLTALGIGIGQADTWVSGVRCGRAALVN